MEWIIFDGCLLNSTRRSVWWTDLITGHPATFIISIAVSLTGPPRAIRAISSCVCPTLARSFAASRRLHVVGGSVRISACRRSERPNGCGFSTAALVFNAPEWFVRKPSLSCHGACACECTNGQNVRSRCTVAPVQVDEDNIYIHCWLTWNNAEIWQWPTTMITDNEANNCTAANRPEIFYELTSPANNQQFIFAARLFDLSTSVFV